MDVFIQPLGDLLRHESDLFLLARLRLLQQKLSIGYI